MALYEVTNTDVLQRCVACNREHRYAFTQLTVGVSRKDQLNPLIIPMPACECGAVEFLSRAPDNEPPHVSPGSFGHLHQMLVQELHSLLVSAGRLAPELKNVTPPIVAGPRLDAATKARWFPNGLKIDIPIKQEGA